MCLEMEPINPHSADIQGPMGPQLKRILVWVLQALQLRYWFQHVANPSYSFIYSFVPTCSSIVLQGAWSDDKSVRSLMTQAGNPQRKSKFIFKFSDFATRYR